MLANCTKETQLFQLAHAIVSYGQKRALPVVQFLFSVPNASALYFILQTASHGPEHAGPEHAGPEHADPEQVRSEYAAPEPAACVLSAAAGGRGYAPTTVSFVKHWRCYHP